MRDFPGRTPLFVVVFDPDGEVTHVPLRLGRITIGRANDNDIAVRDLRLSRHHAALEVGTSILLEDLGSENGTVVHLPGDVAHHDTAKTWREVTRRLAGEVIEVGEGTIINLGN